MSILFDILDVQGVSRCTQDFEYVKHAVVLDIPFVTGCRQEAKGKLFIHVKLLSSCRYSTCIPPPPRNTQACIGTARRYWIPSRWIPDIDVTCDAGCDTRLLFTLVRPTPTSLSIVGKSVNQQDLSPQPAIAGREPPLNEAFEASSRM